jgi:hypothetical protein
MNPRLRAAIIAARTSAPPGACETHKEKEHAPRYFAGRSAALTEIERPRPVR